MRDFIEKHNFILSGNFHEGALVVNYPWDYRRNTPEQRPDDYEMIKRFSFDYAFLNQPMFKSPRFKNGITSGYEWYPINGGIQDWLYAYYDCIDLTIELSNIKWPIAKNLPDFWEDNRSALLNLLENSLIGIYGTVIDGFTNKPLRALIEVNGRKKQTSTQPKTGEYYRLLDPGTYIIKFSAPGYKSYQLKDLKLEKQKDHKLIPIKLYPDGLL